MLFWPEIGRPGGIFECFFAEIAESTQKAFESLKIFKGLRPPAADPQQNEGMMLRGYENHEAIALVTCAS